MRKTSMGNKTQVNIDGHLRYLIENCQTAFRELQILNRELNKRVGAGNSANPNSIGNLHRMVQDYLILRVAGLFDKKSYTVSFEVAYPENEVYKAVRKEKIIEYLTKMRSTFVGHTHQNLTLGFPHTNKILNSNLSGLLDRLLSILGSHILPHGKGN